MEITSKRVCWISVKAYMCVAIGLACILELAIAQFLEAQYVQRTNSTYQSYRHLYMYMWAGGSVFCWIRIRVRLLKINHPLAEIFTYMKLPALANIHVS